MAARKIGPPLYKGDIMDKTDKLILSKLQQNARVSLKELAASVFLSSPATAARLERLEKDGIITGYGVKLDHKKLGYPVVAFINLEMQPRQKEEFYPFVKVCPNVIECNCVTGHYSMLLKVAFPSTEELDGFIGKLQNFGNTETQIVFSCIKQNESVEIQADPAKE